MLKHKASSPWLPQITYRQTISDLVNEHAPVLVFHPNEANQCCFPNDASPIYEQFVRFRDELNKLSQDELNKLSLVIQYKQFLAKLNKAYSPLSNNDIAWLQVALHKEPIVLDRTVKLYYQFSSDDRSQIMRIRYWIWYNYNDFPNDPEISGVVAFGSHEGDWESVEVFLFKGKPLAYFLSNHEGCNGLDPNDAQYIEGRLKVWVAEGSHAHYPSPNAEHYVFDKFGIRFKSIHDNVSDDTSEGQQFTWNTRDQWHDMAQTAFVKDNYTGIWGMSSGSPTSPVARQFDNTNDDQFSIPTYKVIVQTSDIEGAGTDLNVSIELFGSQGNSPIYNLDNMYDNFERGQSDTFFLSTNASFGDIIKIRISIFSLPHDHSPWDLSSIRIKDLINKMEWSFVRNQSFVYNIRLQRFEVFIDAT